MIWVNFKIYKETFADGALKLAKVCQKVSEATKVKIIPVVSPFDLKEIKEKVGGEVWLQHLDLFTEGKYTGWLSPLQAVKAGADGTLLNHSEHEIPPGKIKQMLKIKGLKFMVCVKTRGQVEKWVKKLKSKPDFIAYEPPELIGGKISVSQAKPEVIERIVKLLPDQKVIVGAGIQNTEDVKISLKLGAKGILVSSAVVNAGNPEKELLELARGFKS